MWSIESKSKIHTFTHHNYTVFLVSSLIHFISSASADAIIGIAKISIKSFESFISLNSSSFDSANLNYNLVAYGSEEKVLIWDMNDPNNEINIGSHAFCVLATSI